MVLTLLFAAIAGAAAQSPVEAADPSVAHRGRSWRRPRRSRQNLQKRCAKASRISAPYFGFVREQSIKEDGLLPVLVGVVASLSEARTLAGLVRETYRPLVDDLVTSLTDLESAARMFFDQGTVGAGLVQLGGAITDVGVKLDTLSSAVREPCPTESPAPSPLPAASASPAG